MMNYLESNSILVDYQHGFRQERSCETQLVTFVNELLEAMNNGIETDPILKPFLCHQPSPGYYDATKSFAFQFLFFRHYSSRPKVCRTL